MEEGFEGTLNINERRAVQQSKGTLWRGCDARVARDRGRGGTHG
jgi:hypothetical protein